MKTKRLGKGLEALIPQMSPDETQERKETLDQIPVTQVRANPLQPRADFDRKRLDQLKQSIEENGVIQPITVRVADGGYELVVGERRLRAVQELGYNQIPAYVISVHSDDQLLELALVENIQREDLNPIELAMAYQRLQKEYKLTQELVAQKVGKDRATVSNFIRLLKLPAVIQESLKNEELSMGHARALMGFSSRGDQMQLWRKIVKNGWSVRKVEEFVRQKIEGVEKKPKKSKFKKTTAIVSIEDRIRSLLGSKVRIQYSRVGGKIEISFYSDEDLERLIELFERIEN